MTLEGAPWFVAADVCECLGLQANAINRSYQHHYSRLAADERQRVTATVLTYSRAMVCISESGLFKLVMRSDKAEARKFQDWVTREVLPSLRKHGAYVVGQEKVGTGEMTPVELAQRAQDALGSILKEMQGRLEESQKALVVEREAREAAESRLNNLPLDAWMGMAGLYLSVGEKSRLSQRAAVITRGMSGGIALPQQERVISTDHGARITKVNVYPVAALVTAAREIGVIPA